MSSRSGRSRRRLAIARGQERHRPLPPGPSGEEKLRPSPEADRYALVRRLALDLTGLPPTIAEVDQFVSDKVPDAYEKLVDRLLAREAFGEHWARMWLDLARYADSAGYVSDVPREIWAFRDYVIRSFNANKPFDQFTIEQIAGDLLPNPTRRAAHRHGLPSQYADQQRRRLRPRGVPQRGDRRSGQHDDVGLDGHHHGLRPVPRPQVRSDLAEGILPVLRHLQQHGRRRPRGRASPSFPSTRSSRRGSAKSFRPRSRRWSRNVAEEKAPAPQPKATSQKEQRPEGEKDSKTAAKPPSTNDSNSVANLKTALAAIRPYTVPIQRELPAGKRRTTHIQYRGNFLDRGPQVMRRRAGRLPSAAEGPASQPPGTGQMAGR